MWTLHHFIYLQNAYRFCCSVGCHVIHKKTGSVINECAGVECVRYVFKLVNCVLYVCYSY